MNDLARKAAEKMDINCDLALSESEMGICVSIIQAAIEEAQQNAYNDGWVAGRDALRLEATRELELTSKVDQEVIDKAVRELEVARADTKRLDWLMRNSKGSYGLFRIHFSWHADDNDTLREAIDSDMKKEEK